jgi:HEAT repeat protein
MHWNCLRTGAVGLLCLAALGCGFTEPVYEGRPASYWLAEIKHENGPNRWRAALALRSLGPGVKGAVPALREALKDRDPTVRWAAAGALGSYGPKAKSALPELREMAEKEEDPSARKAAALAVRQVGP